MVVIGRRMAQGACLAMALWAGALWAEVPSPEAMASLTQRAEAAILVGDDPQTLEDLRGELALLRESLTQATKGGDVTVRALQAELGELPPKDAAEPARIAADRARLTEAIAEADAPQLALRQALARTRVLVADLDALIRARQRSDMLERGPTPLWPGTWTAGLGQVLGVLRAEWSLLSGGWIAAGLLSLSLAGWFAAARLMQKLEKGRTPARIGLALTLRAVLPFGLALMGVAALEQPFLATGQLPDPIEPALIAAFMLAAAAFVAQVLFAPFAPYRRLIALTDAPARRAAGICELLGLVVVAELLAEESRDLAGLGDAGQALVALAVIAVAAGLLWSLGRTLGRATTSELAWLLARGLQTLGLVALASVLLGFSALARALVDPLLITLWLIGVGIMLHRVITLMLAQLGRLLGGNAPEADGAQARLMSIALAGLLTFALSPLVAVAWGARVADLGDALLVMRNGVELGGVRVSVSTVLVVALAFGIGLMLTRWVQRILRDEVLPNTKIDRGGQTAIVTGFGYLGVLTSVLLALSLADISLASLAILAGALSVGIGFGLQAIVSNFVCGLILLIERPIKEGDLVQVGGNLGYVRKIAVRATRVETLEGHDLIVPNSDLITGLVRNMTLTDASGRVDVALSLPLETDLTQATLMLMEVARAHGSVLTHPAPVVLVTGTGDSCLNLELRVFVRDVGKALLVRSELYRAALPALADKGLETPYPVRRPAP